MKKIYLSFFAIVALLSLTGCQTKHVHEIVEHEAKEATCIESGHEAYEECSTCDYTTYVELEALGHNLHYFELEEATCTKTGKKEYWFCPDCNSYFLDGDGDKEIIPNDLIIDQIEHLDENNDYLCDYGCGKVLVSKDMLQDVIENTLSKNKVTVNEYNIPSATTTSYYFDDSLLYVNVDNNVEKYIYTKDNETYLLTKNDKWQKEIVTEVVNYSVSYVFEGDFNLEIVSDIESSVCSYGPLEGKTMFSFYNIWGTKVAVSFNEDKTLIEGIYIHEEFGNIIYTFEFIFGETEEIINTLETIINNLN